MGEDYMGAIVTQYEEATPIDSASTTYPDLSISLLQFKLSSALPSTASIAFHLVGLSPSSFCLSNPSSKKQPERYF